MLHPPTVTSPSIAHPSSSIKSPSPSIKPKSSVNSPVLAANNRISGSHSSSAGPPPPSTFHWTGTLCRRCKHKNSLSGSSCRRPSTEHPTSGLRMGSSFHMASTWIRRGLDVVSDSELEAGRPGNLGQDPTVTQETSSQTLHALNGQTQLLDSEIHSRLCLPQAMEGDQDRIVGLARCSYQCPCYLDFP